MSKKLIPTAIYDLDGTVVELPQKRFTDEVKGDLYDPQKHKGHLHCPECEARVHFVAAVGSIAGSRYKGNDEHFQTNPKSGHDADCEIGQKQKEQKPRGKPDPNRGFVFHLNALDLNRYEDIRDSEEFKREFNTKADPMLIGMERVAFRNFGDLLRFVHKQPYERIEKSIVLYQGQKIPWNRYVLTQEDKGASFRKLVNFMREFQLIAQPVIVDFDHEGLTRGAFDDEYHLMVKIKSTFLKTDDKGYKHFIVPRMFIGFQTDNGPRILFWEPGHAMAQGIAMYKQEKVDSKKCVFHYLSVDLQSGIQVMPDVSLADLRDRKDNTHVAAKISPDQLFGFGYRY